MIMYINFTVYSKLIINNMDVRFTSRFWNALHGLLRTRLTMSTTFYPEIDRQTKWVNHVIKDMLQHDVNPMQND